MQHAKLIKGLTLSGFIMLISLFLLYRTGMFDTYLSNEKYSLQTSSNGGALGSLKTDSSKQNKDSVNKLMLSSSKVLILTDKKTRFPDSFSWFPKKKIIKQKQPEMMSSSKSAIIFKPQLTILDTLGSLKFNSTKKTLKR